MEDEIRKKAQLILGGDVLLPPGFRMPYRISRSTAGPGAGKRSAAFSFSGMRVKKGISYESGEFELLVNDNGYSMTRHGMPFLDSVEIIPIAYHSPEQAFFNLDQKCIYNCRFCTSPLLADDMTKGLTEEKIVSLIKDMIKEQKIVSAALTSGVSVSVDDTINKMVSCVKAIKKEFPEMPVGVEPYIGSEEHVIALKEAGAEEIKINRETPRYDIFTKICPDLDHSLILEMLKISVKVFGKGKVTTNLLFGIGESDDDLENEMRELAGFGCVPCLRAVRINELNLQNMKKIGAIHRITEERMISLAKMQKRILDEFSLTTKTFRTMCFECGCCDLVPFTDL